MQDAAARFRKLEKDNTVFDLSWILRRRMRRQNPKGASRAQAEVEKLTSEKSSLALQHKNEIDQLRGCQATKLLSMRPMSGGN